MLDTKEREREREREIEKHNYVRTYLIDVLMNSLVYVSKNAYMNHDQFAFAGAGFGGSFEGHFRVHSIAFMENKAHLENGDKSTSLLETEEEYYANHHFFFRICFPLRLAMTKFIIL